MHSKNLRAGVQRKSERDDRNLKIIILECMANSEIDGAVLIENMDAVFRWIKLGVKPGEKPKLKVVGKGDNGA